MKILDFFTNLLILVILILVIYYIIYKYIFNTNGLYWINKFNNAWKEVINSLYLKKYFNYKTNTLYTDYELNNGLYLDLSNKLNFPHI